MKKLNKFLQTTLTFMLGLGFLTNASAEPSCNTTMTTILSIDGGGVRGVIPAVILNELEYKTNQKSAKLFNFMSGVSTGSILVSLLTTPNSEGTSKYSANEIIPLFKQNSNTIFSSSALHRISSLFGFIGPKYQSKGMEQVAVEYFGDESLSKLLSNVILFGYDMKEKGLLAFSNRQDRNSNMPYYQVKDIILGTTAVMSYFPAKSLYDSEGKVRHRIVDADFPLHNPSAVTFIYAHKKCSDSKHYLILSLGTGEYPKLNVKSKTWGLIQWLPDMLKTTMVGEETTADIIMLKFATLFNRNDPPNSLPTVLYLRINPKIPLEQLDPVDPSLSHLIALENIGKNYSKNNQPMLMCLIQLLKTQASPNLDDKCIALLKNQHPKISELWLDLEGNHPIKNW